jgi:hypothetical protein
MLAGLRLRLASPCVVLPRLRRGVALTEKKLDSFARIFGRQGSYGQAVRMPPIAVSVTAK